jgi:hypothetical protein
MTDATPPYIKRLSLFNLVLGLIALVGLIAVVAALAAGRITLAIVAMVFVGVGIPVAVWATRLRTAARNEPPSP